MAPSPIWRDITSSGEQMLAVVGTDFHIDDISALGVCRKLHRRELLGAADTMGLRQHAARRADLAIEMLRQRQRAPLPQASRALLDLGVRKLRHARRRRARPR